MSEPEANERRQLSNREKVLVKNSFLRNAKSNLVAVRSKAQGTVVMREWQNQDARYDVVVSLLHRWSQFTKASDNFLQCKLLFSTLLLSFLSSFINFSL